MSLTELIAGVEAHEKRLTVFNADDDVVRALRERFADRNLSVEGATAEAGPDNYAVLSENGQFLAAIAVEDVSSESAERTVGFADATYRPVLDQLDETMFTSYSTQKMVAASREIEDRAWRIGRGSLHAGFQRMSVLADELPVYDRLAERDGLSVHAYAYPDGEGSLDASPHLTIHDDDSDEILNSWFVVYDGDGVNENKCALVAEEREPRRFYGFWTYDTETVDYVVNHLEHTYALVGTDGGDERVDV
jgi:DICT domain-containing protein